MNTECFPSVSSSVFSAKCYQFILGTQSCPALCEPKDCSTSGFPVHHQFLEQAQTHVHRVSDAIQPSHTLLSPSPALHLSQHQGLSCELALPIRWPKNWSFSLSIRPSNKYSGLISFRMDWFDLLAVPHICIFSYTFPL